MPKKSGILQFASKKSLLTTIVIHGDCSISTRFFIIIGRIYPFLDDYGIILHLNRSTYYQISIGGIAVILHNGNNDQFAVFKIPYCIGRHGRILFFSNNKAITRHIWITMFIRHFQFPRNNKRQSCFSFSKPTIIQNHFAHSCVVFDSLVFKESLAVFPTHRISHFGEGVIIWTFKLLFDCCFLLCCLFLAASNDGDSGQCERCGVQGNSEFVHGTILYLS